MVHCTDAIIGGRQAGATAGHRHETSVRDLVRFLAQDHSSAERILTDLLASYEFVPGTVVHAGYGSLYEKGIDQIGARPPDDGRAKYLAVNRGLFFKASYLRRF